MNDLLSLVNKLVQTGKSLRDVAERSSDTQTKNLVADLNLALADLKMKFAAAEEDVAALKSDLRKKLSLRHGRSLYYATEGGDEIPFCPYCWESSQKLIHLFKEPASGSGECWACYTCMHNYSAKTPTDNFRISQRLYV